MTALAVRGTSNRNDRGSAESRRRRRQWLVETFRADMDVVHVPAGPAGAYDMTVAVGAPLRHLLLTQEVAGAVRQLACRCYRCGTLLTADTVTVDRIKPGCEGGTYRRDNIRPACGRCNSSTGQALAIDRKQRKANR